MKVSLLDEGPDCGRALRRRPSVPPEKLEPCSWGLRLCVWFSETMLLSNLVAMNVARQQLLWCHAAGGAPSCRGPAGVAVVRSELLLSSQTHSHVESASRARRCTIGWS